MVNRCSCHIYINNQAKFNASQISFAVIILGKNGANCREKYCVYTFVDTRF